MNSDKILVVGIGQAGNNMTEAVINETPRIHGYFINTNQNDWSQLNRVNESNSYVVPCASGTGRDRSKASAYAQEQILALKEIFQKYPNQKHVFIAFSMGGGTGSGMTPTLLKVFSQLYPDIKINLIAILPHKKETRKAQQNAIECWNELQHIDNLGAIYLIDNNKRETKQKINKEFATLFSRMLKIPTETHSDGIIDEADLSKVVDATGLAAIYSLDNAVEEGEDMNMEEDVLDDSIFVMPTNRCVSIALNAPDDIDFDEVTSFYKARKKDLGLKAIEVFEGHGDKYPTLVVAGGRMTDKALSTVVSAITEAEAKLIHDEDEDDESFEGEVCLDSLIEKPIQTKKANKKKASEKIDIEAELKSNPDAFWDKIFNR